MSAGMVRYRACYRTLLCEVDSRYDIRGYMLSAMVQLCLANHGKLPLRQRGYYRDYAQEEAIQFLERRTTNMLYDYNGLLGTLGKPGDGWPAGPLC